MKKDRIRQIAIDAMFFAFIVVMSFVPYIGFIPIPGLGSLTLIHIPIILGALFFGWKKGLLYATFFGLLSWVIALTRGTTALDIVFRNPLFSVLPRVTFGLILGFTSDYFAKRKLFNSKPLVGVYALLATVTHSILVLVLLLVFGKIAPELFATIIGVFGVLEALLAAVIVPILYFTLSPIVSRYNQKSVRID